MWKVIIHAIPVGEGAVDTKDWCINEIYDCGFCFPTYPNIFNPTLNIKWFLEKKKYLKWALFSVFVTIFFVKCFNKT